MCKGDITDPVGRPREATKSKFSLRGTFKKFLDKITSHGSFVLLNKSPVNACLKCGDLEIDNNWQRIPCPHITSIKNAIMTGGILVNGDFKVCDFCAQTEKEIKESQENRHKDTSSICADTLLVPVSSQSF